MERKMSQKVDRKLTQKQERFAFNLFQGMTQREAWVRAGYSSKYDVAIIDNNACNLAHKSEIKERLQELNLKTENKLIANKRERLMRLTQLIREGKLNPKDITPRDRIASIDVMNKMERVYTEAPVGYEDNRVINIIVASEEAKRLTEGVSKFGIFNNGQVQPKQ